MPTAGEGLTTVIIALVLGATMLAQEEPPAAGRSTPPVAGTTAQDAATPSDNGLPDARPITGMLPLTLESFGTERSYLLPSFHLVQAIDSKPYMDIQSDALPVTSLSGALELHRVLRTSQLMVHYAGGGYIYGTDSDLNSTFQQGGVQQLFQFRRWSLTFADDVSYTPEAAFGFGGLVGGSGGSVAPALSPNQSILTGHSKRLGNALVTQANYLINARSSVTVAGTFGLLRFPGGTLQESNQGGALVGYNYSISPRNVVGVSYNLNMTRYQAGTAGTNFDTHTWQFVYGREVTGRVALQLSGGPQISVFRGSVTASTVAGWATQEYLLYRLRQVDFKTSYSHTVTAGAGALPGAHTDQVQGEFIRRISRTIDGSFTMGYAHNSALQAASGLAGSVFDTEFMTASLQRPFGHEATVSLKYTFQHQSANVLACSLGLCGADVSRHIIGMGFDWHMRPLLIH